MSREEIEKRMYELARQYAETHDGLARAQLEALSLKLAAFADALRTALMKEYKNYFVNGGRLIDWPYSSKFRAMSVVLQVRPGGTTVVIKRFVAQPWASTRLTTSRNAPSLRRTTSPRRAHKRKGYSPEKSA